jgi:hypothetical protein
MPLFLQSSDRKIAAVLTWVVLVLSTATLVHFGVAFTRVMLKVTAQ